MLRKRIADDGVVHLALSVVAIVLGVLMIVGAAHVGQGAKAAGVVEVTLGVLSIL